MGRFLDGFKETMNLPKKLLLPWSQSGTNASFHVPFLPMGLGRREDGIQGRPAIVLHSSNRKRTRTLKHAFAPSPARRAVGRHYFLLTLGKRSNKPSASVRGPCRNCSSQRRVPSQVLKGCCRSICRSVATAEEKGASTAQSKPGSNASDGGNRH